MTAMPSLRSQRRLPRSVPLRGPRFLVRRGSAFCSSQESAQALSRIGPHLRHLPPRNRRRNARMPSTTARKPPIGVIATPCLNR
jgi:hypothetical protein